MISLLLGRWFSLRLLQYLPLRLLSSVIRGDVKMDGLDPWRLFDVWPSGAPGQGLRVDILLTVLLTLCKTTLLLPLGGLPVSSVLGLVACLAEVLCS